MDDRCSNQAFGSRKKLGIFKYLFFPASALKKLVKSLLLILPRDNNMNSSSRRLVQQSIDQAIEGAIPALHAKLGPFSTEARATALQCAEGLRTCLKDQADTTTPSPTFQDDLIRLVFGHSDPGLVEALREFLEIVNLYLMEARGQFLHGPGRKDA